MEETHPMQTSNMKVTAQNMSTLINSTKVDKFLEAVTRDKLELGNSEADFLNAVNKDILNKEYPKPTKETALDKASYLLLRQAIQESFNKFDVDLYDSFPNPTGVIRMMVWGRFRALQRDWVTIRDQYVNEKDKAAAIKLQEQRRLASIKKSQKIEEEKLKLGNGDIETGNILWNERKVKQMAEANSNERETNLTQEKAWNDWLMSDEAKQHNTPMKDISPTQFGSFYTRPYGKGEELRFPTHERMAEALLTLANSPNAKNISIRATLDWNKNESFAYPSTFVHTGEKLTQLTGTPDILRGHSCNLVGIMKEGDLIFGVTDRTYIVHRLLPEQFHKNFRARNPFTHVTSNMRALRPLNKSLDRCSIMFRDSSGKIFQTIFTIRAGAQVPDISVVTTSKTLINAQQESKQRLQIKKNEAQNRAKEQREKNHAYSRKNTQKIDLASLIELYQKGMINEKEFSKMKKISVT